MMNAAMGCLVAGLLLTGACTKANPAASCADGTCSDPAFPFCDRDGSVGGEPGTCVAITCQAGANGGCQGSAALVCNADGTSFDPVPCANGCDPNAGCNACTPGEVRCAGAKLQTCGSDAVFADTETCQLACTTAPQPHCAYLSPKYVPDACDVPASGTALAVVASATIDSSLDNNCTGGVVPQTEGPEICVMHYDRISVSSGASLTLVGTRAVALVADNDLTVTGAIEVGATGSVSGPGGGTYESGGGPTTINDGSGGGGAGFRTPGGAGGNGTGDGATTNGGSASGAPIEGAPLRGGPRAAFAAAGGGGGALTAISCRSRVTVLGTIDSRGGGGGGGRVRSTPVTDNPVAGAGAGAGGYVVLQGVSILVTGQTFANGGGGGAGNNTAFTPGAVNGLDGTASDTLCASGGVAPTGAGNGGAGGCGTNSTSQPGDGLHPPATTGRAGGGGGSMGFFQSYTPAGVTPTLVPAHASPGFQPNLTVETR